MKTFLCTALALVVASVCPPISSAEDRIDFDRDVRPILSEYCFACHGPDSETRQADLRLDRRVDAMASGVIVPAGPANSKLVARITSTDPDELMPPPESTKTLSPEHKRLLTRWIAEGAKWEEHWAFVPPERPELPTLRHTTGRVRNPIDRFVFRKLEALGLTPNEEASRYDLARRAALDITGLPPLTETVEPFVTANREDAYEQFVDSLLASVHAGEHRARYWLDAARYSDTHGLHVDNYREIWPYRDWVVRAFNSNMPFDQFTVEQIAGDLLPDPTLEQRIATGFNRCHVTTAEGGAIPEEFNVRYTVDRVDTTATVFLGMTAGCAVCHNHKFDPITQREFYEFSAFFNNTTQPAMDGNKKDTPPVVTLPKEEFVKEWSQLESQRRELRDRLENWEASTTDWWQRRAEHKAHPIGDDDLLLWLPLAEGEGEPITLSEGAHWATGHPAGQRGVRFGEKEGLSVAFPRLRTDDPLTVSFWYRRSDRILEATLFEQLVKTEAEEDKDERRVGWKILGTGDGGLIFEIHDGEGGSVRNILTAEDAIEPRVWHHIGVRYSGGQSNASVSILLNGRPGFYRSGSPAAVATRELPDAPLRIGHQSQTASLSDVRVFRRWLADEEIVLLAQEHTMRGLLGSDAEWNVLKPSERTHLVRFHKNVVDNDYRAKSRELAASQTRWDYIYSRSTTTLVMHERSTPPRAWVLERGEYDKRREEVTADVPRIFARLPEDAPRNRLGLARWLVQPDHPLTARVMVNRLWQSIFGVGIVKTSEDFGVMGERPSHPELLDWLAVEFVDSGWNLKHILRLIVTSATYRQSTVATAEKLEKDPRNRLFSRGPRVRLDAEVLRDQALAVGGSLVRKAGGPGVRPYQPSGLWKVVAIGGSNTGNFRQDSGDALYRRSLYTFWKRTSPPPSMAAFDAPTREKCTVRRERTNTPLQALVLMNDPQYVGAARHVAQSTIRDHSQDRARASVMLATVLGRPGTDDDLTDVLSGAAEFREIFRQKPEAATGLIQTGDSAPTASDPVELATWTLVANMLMNRDDFINKN